MKKKLCALAVTMAVLLASLTVWGNSGQLTAAAKTTENLDSTLNYGQFLGTEGLQGVYDAKTPRTADELEVKWKKQTGSGWNDVPGAPLVVGNYVYCYSSQYLHKYDLETGEELASAQVFGESTNQFMINLCYGDGKIFVPVKTNNMNDGTGVTKGHIRVFDAETLEQLYITDDAVGAGDMQTPVMYHDGYVVTGGYGANASYACYSTSDDDPTRSDEVKKALWSIQSEDRAQSFSWNGAAFAGDYVYFADKGRSPGPASIYAVNYKTGELAQKLALPEKYMCNSTLVYNDKNNRLYVPANNSDGGASIRSYEINADGTLNADEQSVKEWKSGTKGGGTQSTPVIYNDRLYIGGGGGTMGSSEPFHVVDANTMQTIYTIDGLTTKGSAALSTAYATEENGNQVYIYMVPYKADTVWIISDREGQTEPVYETVQIGSNYCSQTIAIAPNGSLVWYQDDKNLYVCGNVNDTTITGEDVNAQIARQADPAGFGYYNKVEIARIHERYDALSDTEKAKVTEYDKLLEIDKVLALDGKNAAERLNSGIAALPETVTLADKEMVQTLRGIYDKLSEDEKETIVGLDKLEAAEAAIAALETAQEIEALTADIAALPAADKLTSADAGQVKKLMAQYEALKEEDQAKVANSAVLLAASKRIAAIEKQMADAGQLIQDTLAGKEITLDSMESIKAVDDALNGLAESDLALITGIEQYLSPAKVDLVNLLIQRLSGMKITKDNAAEAEALIADITYLYGGVLEADLKYVKDYDKVAEAQAQLETLKQEPEKPEGGTDSDGKAEQPSTGEAFPVAVVWAFLTAGIAGSTLLLKRRRA